MHQPKRLLRIRGTHRKTTTTWGRERAFEALKNGQEDMTERPEKDTKDRTQEQLSGVVRTTSP